MPVRQKPCVVGRDLATLVGRGMTRSREPGFEGGLHAAREGGRSRSAVLVKIAEGWPVFWPFLRPDTLDLRDPFLYKRGLDRHPGRLAFR
jgi:hypothetical protein